MKLALIGSGRIILDALYALKAVDSVEVKALYVREHSLDKGIEIAKDHNIPQDIVFTDYEALLDNADIDAVYIGLVNSAHYEYSKIALEHGKNVIVEKPFTDNYSKAKDLYNLAKEKELMIFEAVTILHTEVFSKLKESLLKIGNIRIVNANYSQYSSAYDSYLEGSIPHAFDKAHLGGCMRDINIYNLHYTIALFGMPKKANYIANRGFNGIDTSGVLVLSYESFICVLTGAKDSDSECFFSIQGEKGTLRIDGKPNVASNLKIKVIDDKKGTQRDKAGASVRAAVETEFIPKDKHHRMCDEFKAFALMIDSKDYEKADYFMKETLDVMMVIDMIKDDL